MGSRTKVVDTGLDGTTFERKIKANVATYTLAASGVIDKSAPMLHFINPGAARNVRLPANSDSKNLMFIVFNASTATSGQTITFNTATGAALVPAATAAVTKAAILVNDGNGWRALVGGST